MLPARRNKTDLAVAPRPPRPRTSETSGLPLPFPTSKRTLAAYWRKPPAPQLYRGLLVSFARARAGRRRPSGGVRFHLFGARHEPCYAHGKGILERPRNLGASSALESSAPVVGKRREVSSWKFRKWSIGESLGSALPMSGARVLRKSAPKWAPRAPARDPQIRLPH